MKTETIHCSQCLRHTKHIVLAERKNKHHDYLDDEGHAIGSSELVWVLYECKGCENVVLRRRFWHTDMEPGESEEESFYNSWFPPLVSRQIPEWHQELADAERRLVLEVYIALHAEALSLVTMGIRALLDMYIVRKVGDAGTFRQKLDRLKQGGFLSAAQILQIEPALNAGNAAAHRGFCPTAETVTFALDVVEVLLQQDILGNKSEQIDASIPQRVVLKNEP